MTSPPPPARRGDTATRTGGGADRHDPGARGDRGARHDHRRRRLLALGLIPVAGLLAAACSSTGSPGGSTGTTTTTATGPAATPTVAPDVTTAKVGSLGRVLTNSQGQVLYTFTTSSGASAPCNASCLQVWPADVVPAATTQPTGSTGVGTLGITTANGLHQVTVDGLALYTYAGDSAPGVADGNNLTSFGGTWRVVKVTAG
jgi:predicted lipoprotein with Yx(FWY)xxD motif